MRTWLLASVAAVAVACGSGGPSVIDTVGTVELRDVDGGAWLMRATNGVLYEPRNLPDAYKVVGARAQVPLVVDPRHLWGEPVPADIVSIEEASCEHAGCGVAEHFAEIRVVDASSSGPVQGVTLTNVGFPAQRAPGFDGCWVGDASYTHCEMIISGPGTFPFDVTAPGYQTAHATLEVLAHQHVPGVCCELPWEDLYYVVDVSLSPVG